jgi:hypothetical protein
MMRWVLLFLLGCNALDGDILDKCAARCGSLGGRMERAVETTGECVCSYAMDGGR